MTEIVTGVVVYSADPKGYGHSIGLKGVDGFFNASKNANVDLSQFNKGDNVKFAVDRQGKKNYVLKARLLDAAPANGQAGSPSGGRWEGDWNASLARAIELVGLEVQAGAVPFAKNAKVAEKQALLKERVDEVHATIYNEIETKPCLKAAEEIDDDLRDEPDEADEDFDEFDEDEDDTSF